MHKVSDMKKLDGQGHMIDIQIAAGMVTIGLLNDQGLQAIQQVLHGANDPVQALAHVIFMAISKVKQELQKRDIKIDDKVWIAGGGVLDRVLFEVMMVLTTALQFQQAQDSKFVASVKGAVLDLMHDDDQNSESIATLHDKGLPIPKQGQGDGSPQDQGPPSGGLAAPGGQQ